MEALRERAAMLRTVRAFFDDAGSLEVETPALVRSPGVDVHLDAIEAGDGYLATSPEYHMKRLLAAGSGPIHQLGKAWRAGEAGAWHEPEFTMLEWYVPGFDDAALMDQTEALVRACAAALDVPLDARPFDRLTWRDAFVRHAGFDPADADRRAYGRLLRAAGVKAPRDGSLEDLEDLTLALVVQPELGRDHPAFVTDWPASRAALARLRDDDPTVAARFELYWHGAELCNGYHELTDAAEQRARIERDNAARVALGKHPYPVDEDFLAALDGPPGLPPCAGNALGIDRLLMVLLDVPDIGRVRTFRVDL